MEYQSSEEKARDNHSSAYMLLIVGGLGFVFDLVNFLANPFGMPLFNKYLTTGVMGALFVLFFVMGAVSMRDYGKLREKASKENTLRDAISAWCAEKLSGDVIDEAVREENSSEYDDVNSGDESLYFERTEYIKKRISEKFLNLDEELVDHFVDEYYSQIYDDSTDENEKDTDNT